MRAGRAARLLWLATVVTSLAGCASGPLAGVLDRRTPEEIERDRAEAQRAREEEDRRRAAEARERARDAVPVSPDLAQPSTTSGTAIWKSGLTARGLRIMVGTESRGLWLMRDTTVLFRAPVAVGMEEGFTYNGRKYDFTTPVGRRRVLAKGTDPLWVPPDWHYFEIAHQRDLKVVQLKRGSRIKLGDESHLEVRGDEVGRVNQFGNFWPFTPGTEIIFDETVYVPPIGSKQRQIPEVLGTHKLEMGDGYLIHGTNQETSIGDAVSHGCVRMYNEDVARLYELVAIGTPVYIF